MWYKKWIKKLEWFGFNFFERSEKKKKKKKKKKRKKERKKERRD